MPHYPARTRSLLEDKVRRLENQLFSARLLIISQVPPELSELLNGQRSCKTFLEVDGWVERTANSIIEIAGRTDSPAGRNWDGRLRVRCPLCGNRPNSPFDEGFLLNEGLRRHLLGTHSSQQCPVFKAAHQLALDRASPDAEY